MTKNKTAAPRKKVVAEAVVLPGRPLVFPAWVGFLLIVVLGTVIYANSFDCAFQLDDFESIVNNTKIRNLSDVSSWSNIVPTRAIGYGSFAVNYHFHQLDVQSYHFVNLLIHLLNALLVWGLSLQIFSVPAFKGTAIEKDRQLLALMSALLFVSHPLATGSVTYIVQRLAALVATFYLLSVWLYLKARLSQGSFALKSLFFAGAGLSAILAMLTKENAFTLPGALLLAEVSFIQRKPLTFRFSYYRIKAIFVFAIACSAVLWRMFPSGIFRPIAPDLVNNFTEITPANYLLTQFSVIVKYIQLLIIPMNQNVDYDFPVSHSLLDYRTILSLLLLLVLLAIAVKIFRKHRIISFGIFWFFLTLSIESSVIPISDVIFEHRTYLPSFGFFLILVLAVHHYCGQQHQKLALALFIGLVATYAVLAFNRNKVWKTPTTLWSDVIEKSPNKARGYNNRGIMLNDQKKYAQAISDFSRAVVLQPRYATAFYNRGISHQSTNRMQEAFADFDRAVTLDSMHVEAINNRGLLHQSAQRYAAAEADYSRTIRLQPDYFKGYFNRGILYGTQNRLNEAQIDFDRAIELNPNLGDTYFNRAVVTFGQGNKEKACSDWRTAATKGYAQAQGMLDKYCK